MNSFDLKGARLLVVDDQPDNLRLVADFLEGYGADVMLGHDGTDGLAKARLGHPDLILLDVMMPDMDGFEMCRRLKQDAATRDIPVIFLTALHEVEDKLRGFQAGGVDYLTKPLQELEVLARVDVHLKLSRALVRAEAASRAKSRFLANMNHEIRTPISAVLGFAALMEEDEQDCEQRRHLESIRKAGSLLLNLIDGILDLSRLESDRLSLEPTPTQLPELLRDVETLFSAEAIHKGLSLQSVCAPDRPWPLMLDDLRLRQVLINLVGNALKFTRQGGIDLLTRCVQRDDGRVDLEIAVRDTGMGIPAEELERIFDAFTQRQDQRHADYGGTGLGLSISRHLADLMGGSLEVSSTPAVGSTFTLRLPAREVAPEVPTERPAEPTDWQFEPARLLVADDDPPSRLLMVEFLSRSGFEVLTAENGEQALSVAREHQPDLILIDLNMPVMQGDEAVRLLAEQPRTADIPVIVMSATEWEQVYPKLQVRIAGYLAKPFTRTDLLGTLSAHLRCHPTERSKHAPDSIGATDDGPLSLSSSELERWHAIPAHPSVNQVENFARALAQSADAAVRRMGERLLDSAMVFDSVAIAALFEEMKQRVANGETNRH